MTRRTWCAAVLAAATLALARPAAAQLPWDSPSMLAARSPAGFGIHLVTYARPQQSFGVPALVAAWRASPGGPGIRAGIARGANDGEYFLGGGVDFASRFSEARAGSPVDLAWTAGASAGQGDYAHVAVPVGLVAGRGFGSGGVWFHPYAGARATLEARFGEDRPPERFDLALNIDLGADLGFGTAPRVFARFGASLGDRPALAFGLHAGPPPARSRPATATR
jgi:hypothetical protein